MSPFIKSRRIEIMLSALLCLIVFEFHSKSGATSFDGATLRRKHTLTGNIQIHPDFQSRFLPFARDISVYLPPGYDKDQTRKYPVLYMQDGQNIFDEATSFFAGKEGHWDELAETLITQHEIEPLIIVGVESSGLARLNEFTPPTGGPRQGGQADLYGRMLVEEVKPFIDSHYRTMTQSSRTSLGGVSLGGLVTLYLGLKYQDVFGQLAITSPAAFWDDDIILRCVQSLPRKTNQRIYLSVGTAELPEFLNSTRNLRQALASKGWKEGSDFEYVEVEGAKHEPNTRAIRVDRALRFLSPVLNKRSAKAGGA